MKRLSYCIHCKEPIQEWDGSTCGWVHTNGRVQCLLDATPMGDIGKKIHEHNISESPFVKFGQRQNDQEKQWPS